ncbi:glutathione S-transferase [Litorivivens lipolytica]|uniref:Glutathione S-transferase n=1 Tax=Litorivivens lipolytica TaxID=1524264 RepID=A0A7W4Z675_9GAMM|nr:glutathione S-transferase [Litorivivens lipolytica]MBB3046636.1 glutathione S-transferase [Litorivivens lipolytica]
MEYISVEQAREQGGLRLVLCAGTPGVWGEAIKAVLSYKGISYTPVLQEVGGENRALREWTGQTSAPVIVDANNRQHILWESMVLLAEELEPEPALIPQDPSQRVQHFGLLREIAGVEGLGWNRRLQSIALSGGPSVNPVLQRLADKYGYSDEAVKRSEARTVEILNLLSAQLKQGGPYFFGDQPTALDFYAAIFIGVMINPLPHEVIPMPKGMRAGFSHPSEAIASALDTVLLAHRDRIFERHIKSPLTF